MIGNLLLDDFASCFSPLHIRLSLYVKPNLGIIWIHIQIPGQKSPPVDRNIRVAE